MPKFSKHERDIIKKRLFTEGEKLFSVHGVRKVTINDLTTAAGISHGAFYTFFESKEHLFMEINLKKQQEIFDGLECLFYENKNRKPRKLMKLVICFVMDKFFNDPIISSINGESWKYLSRRIPPETIENNNINDAFVVQKLTEVGVKFNYPTSLVVKTVQFVFMLASSLISDEENQPVMDIIIDGIIEKIVEE
ncbi:TetR/AcrR family transcriptional regulator [Paramaledivibacter caminithermalis]|jgi:AcrR family transcriptional regulator|uniref:Transcriptional regulator, TetR family n=1 Tax=Paramaledivibacter caminithermalis (strain DSM 15212 / CIP 107654 / DViRD3) TaxID=1121301 RepID=A0A1M6SEW7_PARC5|nr:TetR/AcrR family transcriptional regulator [Paramaledivibacter caminithermalis]SHK43324.1 transcriptional regulator, TetR family [Paramaledivibacter caminithermalis DSM 15212]